jgi:hypothetical protein
MYKQAVIKKYTFDIKTGRRKNQSCRILAHFRYFAAIWQQLLRFDDGDYADAWNVADLFGKPKHELRCARAARAARIKMGARE